MWRASRIFACCNTPCVFFFTTSSKCVVRKAMVVLPFEISTQRFTVCIKHSSSFRREICSFEIFLSSIFTLMYFMEITSIVFLSQKRRCVILSSSNRILNLKTETTHAVQNTMNPTSINARKDLSLVQIIGTSNGMNKSKRTKRRNIPSSFFSNKHGYCSL